jgi:hypothetical protein
MDHKNWIILLLGCILLTSCRYLALDASHPRYLTRRPPRIMIMSNAQIRVLELWRRRVEELSRIERSYYASVLARERQRTQPSRTFYAIPLF